MPAPVIYTPPPFRRYFGLTNDPNSAAGGTNLETMVADTVNFPTADIPDITNAWPVITATADWGKGVINRDNEVTGVRASRPPIPFKATPTIPFTVDAYRYTMEKALKSVMGAEGAITGAGPYAHPLSVLPFGAGIIPSLNLQIIRDSMHHKATGAVLESVECTFPFDGPGTVACEAHPLYMRQEPSTVAMPTGVIPEVNAQPILVRDATIVFDGGTSTIGINQFSFGVKNNGRYDWQSAGHCSEQRVVGTPGVLRQLWFPHYHKIIARHTVTFHVGFEDTQEIQETAMQWGQIQKVVVTLADPTVAGNSIVITQFATEIEGGGVDALTASGNQTAAFDGRGYYSASDGTDILVTVNNQSATPI